MGQIGNSQNSQFRIDNSDEKKTFDSIVNKAIERAKKELNLSEKEHSEIMATISVLKGNEFTEDGMFSFVKDTIIQLREKSLYSPDNKNNKPEQYSDSNERDDIRYQTNINNGIKNNNSIEISAADNEFSIFNNEDNNINSGENQNLAKNGVNNIVHDSSDLSEQELNDLDKEISGLVSKGTLQENEVQFYKESRIAEIKKDKKENLEYQQQVENIIKQSELENENIGKRYKEDENNLGKIIPKGYRLTSLDTKDKIIGDGNCFYRAIAKLEKKDQEKYGEIRKTISDEINKSAELFGESADKIDNNLLTLIQLYAWEYNELKDVEEVNENNLSGVLYQIKEHVKGEDKKNEYAGPIEAYFYAKAAKKTVILYDSSNQVHVFIPDKKGDSVHVEHVDPDKIENHIKENKIDIANAVKLAYNATGKHYEAIVPVDIEN